LRKTANEFGLKPGDTIQVKSPQSIVAAKYGTIYSDVPHGEEIAFVNNNLGVVQLSINMGNFAKTYGVTAGTEIEIEK
jgi:S-adenosylmethionine hydrolase